MSGEKHEKKITVCLTDAEDEKWRRVARRLNMDVSVALHKAAINGLPTIVANKMARRYELEDMEID